MNCPMIWQKPLGWKTNESLVRYTYRDPFDRMIIAQAKVERFTIITRDTNIMKYKVPVIKA